MQDEDELCNWKVIITILYVRFCFSFAHLQHSNVSNANAVCALYHDDDDDDCFYMALFSALEQTHCARM